MTRFAKKAAVLVLAVLGLQASVLVAADWPQYRGSNGDGISTETVKLPWGAAGPKVLWKVPTEEGFSSFAVAGGGAFTIESRNGREFCVARNAATGKEAWAADVDVAKYDGQGNAGTKDNNGGDGPRSTPAVSDGMVYVTTTDLNLYCLDGKSGKTVWTKDLVKEFGGKAPGWGNAASPVIDGDLLFVGTGGKGESFVAFNKKTGSAAWKTGTEKITHATPVVATILGQRQVIFFVQKGLISLDTATGKQVWEQSFGYSTSTAASPVVCGDIVYCSAGYGIGGGAFKIARSGEGFASTQLWRTIGNKEVPNHWSTPVFKDGYLYGMFSFKKFGVGPFKCVEVATGKIMWEQPGFGAGNVILAGGKLLALTDAGEVVAITPDASGYKEICRTKAVSGKCWSTPALSDGKLYVRSTKEGACLDLGGK